MNEGIINGWPGLYWIEQTSSLSDLSDPKHTYYCKINNGEIYRTHAIVRALNWWNDLYDQLGRVDLTDLI